MKFFTGIALLFAFYSAHSNATPLTLDLGAATTYTIIEKNSYNINSAEIYHEVILKSTDVVTKKEKIYLLASEPLSESKPPIVLVDGATITLEKDSKGFFWQQTLLPKQPLRIRIQQEAKWSTDASDKLLPTIKTCMAEKLDKIKTPKSYFVITFGKWEKQNRKLTQLLMLDIDASEDFSIAGCPLEFKEIEPGVFQYRKTKTYITTAQLLLIRYEN